MTFEEEFPSLKDKLEDYDVPTYPDGTIIEGGYVEMNDIQKHCLDKQRVKEAVFAMSTKFPDRQLTDESIWLLKELGLE